jgi:putative ABC transport system permease protein
VPSVIAGAFAVGFIATLAAAVLPASKVRKIPVVDALRQSI